MVFASNKRNPNNEQKCESENVKKRETLKLTEWIWFDWAEYRPIFPKNVWTIWNTLSSAMFVTGVMQIDWWCRSIQIFLYPSVYPSKKIVFKKTTSIKWYFQAWFKSSGLVKDWLKLSVCDKKTILAYGASSSVFIV